MTADKLNEALETLYKIEPNVDWNNFRLSLNQFSSVIHGFNKAKGFWDKPKEVSDLETAFLGKVVTEDQAAALDAVVNKFSGRNVGELLMLQTSELGEAMEAHRKDKDDDHLPHLKGLDTEIVDCLIRIFDMAGGVDIALGDVTVQKLAYNLSRPYKHGKKY